MVRHALPSDLDTRDPQFPHKAALSNFQTQSDMLEIIAATKQTLAISRELLTEADRVLARR